MFIIGILNGICAREILLGRFLLPHPPPGIPLYWVAAAEIGAKISAKISAKIDENLKQSNKKRMEQKLKITIFDVLQTCADRLKMLLGQLKMAIGPDRGVL